MRNLKKLRYKKK